MPWPNSPEYICWIIWPKILPKAAPIIILGTKRPAARDSPEVTMTRKKKINRKTTKAGMENIPSALVNNNFNTFSCEFINKLAMSLK